MFTISSSLPQHLLPHTHIETPYCSVPPAGRDCLYSLTSFLRISPPTINMAKVPTACGHKSLLKQSKRNRNRKEKKYTELSEAGTILSFILKHK